MPSITPRVYGLIRCQGQEIRGFGVVYGPSVVAVGVGRASNQPHVLPAKPTSFGVEPRDFEPTPSAVQKPRGSFRPVLACPEISSICRCFARSRGLPCPV